MGDLVLRIANLNPPLGEPGGPCQVVNRIVKKVKNPNLQESLRDEVEKGNDLSNQDASKVYPLDREPGIGPIDSIEITSHGQYRMDLRRITIEDVRAALGSFLVQLDNWKKLGSKAYDSMMKSIEGHEKITWKDPRSKLILVFAATGNGKVQLVTTYWANRAWNESPPGACTVNYDRRS